MRSSTSVSCQNNLSWYSPPFSKPLLAIHGVLMQNRIFSSQTREIINLASGQLKALRPPPNHCNQRIFRVRPHPLPFPNQRPRGAKSKTPCDNHPAQFSFTVFFVYPLASLLSFFFH